MGVDQLLLILIGVDVVLGPLMTTILYDPTKGRWLYLDLAVVAILQIGALAYGLHSIYGGRPALIVFNIDRFDAVQASSMDATGLASIREKSGAGLPLLKPRIVAALFPSDPKEKEDIMFSSMSGGPDITELAQYHVPYEQAARQAAARARPISELRVVNSLDDAAWASLLKSLPLPEGQMGYLPLKGREVDGIVIVARQDGEIIRLSSLLPRWTQGG